MNQFKRIFLFCISSLLVIASNLGRADDIEIYFSPDSVTSSADVIRPNVLFILDTSGSMDTPTSSGQSRMDDLKDAMETVLENLEDVNVGLMRFKFTNGGSVIYPMSNIDGRASDVVGFSGNSLVSEIVNTAFIEKDDDDGEEIITTGAGPAVGSVTLSDTTLDAFDFGGTQSVVGSVTEFPIVTAADDGMEETNPGDCAAFFAGNFNAGLSPVMWTGNAIRSGSQRNGIFIHKCTLVGLRFAGITIPNGTTIANAFIKLRARVRKTNATTTTIVGQAIGDAPQMAGFETLNPDISTRPQTTANVEWSGVPVANAGTDFQTPDIKEIVQEIVNRPDWGAGNAMFFRFQNGAAAPVLGAGCCGVQGSNTRGATNGSNRNFRAREEGANSARLVVEIAGSGTAVAGQDQMIALRFADLKIPQGATLTEAKLVLTPKAAPATPLATTWRVRAEQADDSAPLENALSNISNRSAGGASVNWALDSSTLVNVIPDPSGDPNLAAGDPEESVDISAVLQSVVDRSGWCGGNAMTLLLDTSSADVNQTRFLHSRDSDSTNAPRLIYKFSAGSTGCVKSRETAQTGLSGDDAEQFDVNVDTIDNDLDIGFDTESGQQQTVGLRFRGIDIPKDATILDAKMIFTSRGVSSGDAIFTIKGIADSNVAQFSNVANDITSRPTTTNEVSWDSVVWDTPATSFPTDSITSIVQEIVNRADWVSGNTMGFVIEGGSGYSGSNPRVAETADGDVSKAPRIEITYQTILETPFVTNRDKLIEMIKGLPTSDLTPITATLVEAAKYWRGEPVFHGKSRSNERKNRLSHPGSYCTAPGACAGATINGTTDNFGVNKIGSCNMETNPDSNNCKDRFIKGNPTYISPFKTDLTCATNHQVLLSDGAEIGSGNVNRNYIKSLPGINSCVTDNTTIARPGEQQMIYFTGEQCAPELTRFLSEEDQSSTLGNNQTVKTHTIGFDISDVFTTQFLRDLANTGGGELFEASTAGELVTVFEDILTTVKNDPTSFVSPALATNAFNRLLSRDEVYFGLFTPSLNRAWDGNVKKYKICVTNEGPCGSKPLGTIMDDNDIEAIDSTNDKFKDSAQSIWSNPIVDGKATTLGGAGHQVKFFNNQILYTDKNNTALASNGQLLSGTGFELKHDNWDSPNFSVMRSAVCPVPDTASGSECEKRMLYLLGKSSTTNPDTDISTTQRWSVNDVLHSSPVVITYNGRDTNADGSIDTFFDKILYGTNDGSLHMVNAESGNEEWRYMPSDFWGQQQQIFTNAEGNHIYGLDTTPTIQVIDDNDNGVIDVASDKVRAFTTSRRGGSSIYALDLTDDIQVSSDKVTPRFMWRIQGGAGDFPRLGQTWSKPTIAKIALDTGSGIQIKEVLVFGGGYDAALDNPATYNTSDHGGVPFMGNAIYIVDPENGNKLLSISGSSAGADISVPGMNFSIPSSVVALDSDGDGTDDRLYVGDTGGQIWRVDLAPLDLSSTYSSSAGSSVVGKLAEISASSVPTKKRRFFEPPSVVQVRDTQFSNEANYDYVLLGTGYRSHPLDNEVEDRFYAIRDFQTGANEMRDDNDNNISDATEAYPQVSGDAFTDSDFINVTSTILNSSDATHRAAAGWFYDFTDAGTVGEKVLSPAVTTGGVVTFTTFAPEATTSGTPDPCGASLGLGTAYNFDILSAGAALDWDNDGTITNADRTFELASGIPSGVVPVFTTEGVIGIVGVEGGAKRLGKLADSASQRSYWYEVTEF